MISKDVQAVKIRLGEHDNLIIEDVEEARSVLQGSLSVLGWSYGRCADETGYRPGTGEGVSPNTVRNFDQGVTKYPRFESVVRMLKAVGTYLVTYQK